MSESNPNNTDLQVAINGVQSLLKKYNIVVSLLCGIGTWILLVGIGLLIDGTFGGSGPEHGVPVPVFMAAGIFFGWIPALIVFFRARSNR